jgi:hypothetical protein
LERAVTGLFESVAAGSRSILGRAYGRHKNGGDRQQQERRLESSHDMTRKA